jgi:hypothetical protein
LHVNTPSPEQVDWPSSQMSAWQVPPAQFEEAGQSVWALHTTQVEVAVSQSSPSSVHSLSEVHAFRHPPATQCWVPAAHSASVRQFTQDWVVVSQSCAPQSEDA